MLTHYIPIHILCQQRWSWHQQHRMLIPELYLKVNHVIVHWCHMQHSHASTLVAKQKQWRRGPPGWHPPPVKLSGQQRCQPVLANNNIGDSNTGHVRLTTTAKQQVQYESRFNILTSLYMAYTDGDYGESSRILTVDRTVDKLTLRPMRTLEQIVSWAVRWTLV